MEDLAEPEPPEWWDEWVASQNEADPPYEEVASEPPNWWSVVEVLTDSEE